MTTDSGEDSAFFAVMTESDLTALQRAEQELRVMINCLQGRNVAILRAFKRNFPSLSLKTSILMEKHFASQQERSIFSSPQTFVSKF